MAWRAALDSIPTNLLSRQEKGELIALIVVKQTYQTEILDAAVTGLDVEALSGFFRSLLPVSTSTSAVLTPPKPTFIKMLQERQLPKGSTREQVVNWVNALPISTVTKHFLESNVYTVAEEMYVQAALGGMVHLPCVIRRLDYNKVLKKKDNAKVLVLSGIRRQGKTCALPMELVHARFERNGVRDKAIFYYTGMEDSLQELGVSRLNTVVLILAHAGIATCWDEFQFLVEDLGRAYKYVLEQSNVYVEPLSVLMWGSSEPQVQEKAGALMSGLRSRGAFSFILPEPSIEVLLGIYYLSKGCYKDETGYFEMSWDSKDFLERFTLCGYDLEAHIAQGQKDVEVADYVAHFESGLNQYGRWGSLLLRLAIDCGDCSSINPEDLLLLQRRRFIELDPRNKKRVDFLNPEVLMYSTLLTCSEGITSDMCANAEGRVFEVLVRGEHLLLPQLLHSIAEKGKLHERVPTMDLDIYLAAGKRMQHGTFSKECEIDGFFHYASVFFVLSMKRTMSAQNMDQLIRLLHALKRYVNKNKGSHPPGWQLMDSCTECIFAVDVSAICDKSFEPLSGIEFDGKPVIQISITLTELVAAITPQIIGLPDVLKKHAL